MEARIRSGEQVGRWLRRLLQLLPGHGSQVSGDDYSPLQLVIIAGRSAEFCLAHFTGETLRKFWAASNSPAPVETDRRPENARFDSSLFAADTAPALLREGRCNPTAHQEAAESELIKA